MKFRQFFKSSKIYVVLFTVSIFLLFFIAGISNKKIQSLNESQELIIHSHKVQLQLERLLSQLKDAGRGQRGYLATQDKEFLEIYDKSLINIKESLANLKVLYNVKETKNQDLENLESQITIFLRLLAESENLKKETVNLPEIKSEMIEAKTQMNLITIQSTKMIYDEINLLQQHQRQHQNQLNLTPIISILVLLFSLLVFLFSFHRIYTNFQKFALLNEKLRNTNKTFEMAESIANMGHWERDMITNKANFSDNYFRILGMVPQEMEVTPQNFFNFVHPDDISKLKSDWSKQLQHNTKKTYFYRIIRKNDGKLRYFKSTAIFNTNDSGKKVILGVTCDITDENSIKAGLEQKNRELQNINTELSSFNHIASHDLQEPLRKIQMFISRIKDLEINTLSATSQDYFSKIQDSSNRMQTLIQDLLLYSKVGKGEVVKEDVDLNALLKITKIELTQPIEEKKAILKSDILPTIFAVPFQMQQVFTNIISNSLKYSKSDKKPIIKISYKLVSSREVDEIVIKKHKNYHKITISDNGIGFEQEYADKIFVLFHRLHAKSEYSGTGIGLAICKKIIENHQGYISVISKSGIGTTFTILLPKN